RELSAAPACSSLSLTRRSSDLAFAYTGSGGQSVLFGGNGCYTGGLLGDTWIFNSATSTWTQSVGGPTPRYESTLTRDLAGTGVIDRKSTRLNSSHRTTSYAVFC